MGGSSRASSLRVAAAPASSVRRGSTTRTGSNGMFAAASAALYPCSRWWLNIRSSGVLSSAMCWCPSAMNRAEIKRPGTWEHEADPDGFRHRERHPGGHQDQLLLLRRLTNAIGASVLQTGRLAKNQFRQFEPLFFSERLRTDLSDEQTSEILIMRQAASPLPCHDGNCS